VELGRIPHRAWWQQLGEVDRAAVEQAMASADVAGLRRRVVTTLSGGERARVMLARVFATEPAVILADEPVAALDPFHQLQVMRTLREHAGNGGGVVVVMHDLNLAARFCDRLVALDGGQVVSQGPAREVLEDPALAAAFGVQIEVVEEGGELWVRYR
jgi:iron complex transport system ATP-binding protein